VWGIILKWILEIHDGVVRTGFIWLRPEDQWRAVVSMTKNVRIP
jgi:hypothetical protein